MVDLIPFMFSHIAWKANHNENNTRPKHLCGVPAQQYAAPRLKKRALLLRRVWEQCGEILADWERAWTANCVKSMFPQRKVTPQTCFTNSNCVIPHSINWNTKSASAYQIQSGIRPRLTFSRAMTYDKIMKRQVTSQDAFIPKDSVSSFWI